MPDLLQKGADWLARTQARHVATEVYYQRGESVVSVRATKGQSTFQVDQGDGSFVEITVLDFVVRVEELEIDGMRVEPAAGDRIYDGAIGEAIVYEVMSLPGEPAWRFTDPHRVQYRIHTKQVEDQRAE